MLVKDSTLKRLVVFSVVAMLVIASSMFVTACHRSKGGGTAAVEEPQPPPPPPPLPGTPPPDVVFTSTAEAANGLPAVQGVRALADNQFTSVMQLVADTRPPGFAPGMDKDAIGTLSPDLLKMADAMEKLAQSPAIRKAVAKAGELKTASMLATMRTQTVPPTTITADMCPAGGSVTISGTNNLDQVNAPNLTSTYEIVYADCADDVLFTVLTGTVSVTQTESIETAAIATSVDADLTQTNYAIDPAVVIFDPATATQTQVVKLADSFSDSNQGATGEKTATGSIAMTDAATGITTAYAWTDLRDRRDNAVDTAGHTDEQHAITGSLKVTTVPAGATAPTKSLTMAMAIEDVWHIVANDPTGTRRRTVEGIIDVSRSPDLSLSGCLDGRLNISMPNLAATLEYKAASGYNCPISGVIKANNSSITYGVGVPIHVTLDNGADQTYADCVALNAAAQVCGY